MKITEENFIKELESKNEEALEYVIRQYGWIIVQEDVYGLERGENYDYILAHLNETDRDLFKRLYIEEQTMKEVAEQTGIKTEVIYNRVSRGKRRIRELFQGIGR